MFKKLLTYILDNVFVWIGFIDLIQDRIQDFSNSISNALQFLNQSFIEDIFGRFILGAYFSMNKKSQFENSWVGKSHLQIQGITKCYEVAILIPENINYNFW